MILKYVFLYLSVALCTKTETIIVLITFQSLIIMIKKEYLQPEVAIVHLAAEQTILTGSSIVNVAGVDVAWSGVEEDFDAFFN